MTADDLKAALAAREAVATRAKELVAKLAELKAADLANADALVEARQILDHQLGLETLGEPADVATANARHYELSEKNRGFDVAIDLVSERIKAAADELTSADTHVDGVMAALAAELFEGCKQQMLEECERFAASFELLMKLDHAQRMRGGYLTGDAAQAMAGNPDDILARHHVQAQHVYPALRERVHDLKPAEMIALLENPSSH